MQRSIEPYILWNPIIDIIYWTFLVFNILDITFIINQKHNIMIIKYNLHRKEHISSTAVKSVLWPSKLYIKDNLIKDLKMHEIGMCVCLLCHLIMEYYTLCYNFGILWRRTSKYQNQTLSRQQCRLSIQENDKLHTYSLN